MSDETPAPVAPAIHILAIIFGAMCYVGALLLGWLADAPGEVTEPLKGFGYALALMTPSVVSAFKQVGKP